MTDQEILRLAIEEVGIETLFPNKEIEKWRVISPLGKPIYLSVFLWDRNKTVFDGDITYEIKLVIEQIVFWHLFAKAFWGEEDKYIEKYMEIMEGSISDYISLEDWNKDPRQDEGDWLRYEPVYKWNNRGWQYHLQQMVLEENPIKYLEQFLDSH